MRVRPPPSAPKPLSNQGFFCLAGFRHAHHSDSYCQFNGRTMTVRLSAIYLMVTSLILVDGRRRKQTSRTEPSHGPVLNPSIRTERDHEASTVLEKALVG